jgi:salicylate hydroxylase
MNSNESTFENHAQHLISIIGGGLGGLAPAIGLLKHGNTGPYLQTCRSLLRSTCGGCVRYQFHNGLHLIDPKLLEGYKKHATFNAHHDPASTLISFRWGIDERKYQRHRVGDMMWDLNND